MSGASERAMATSAMNGSNTSSRNGPVAARLVERTAQRLDLRQARLTPPLHRLGRQIARGVIEMRDGATVHEPLQVLVQHLEPREGGIVVRGSDDEHVAEIRGAKLLAELAIGCEQVGRHRRQARDAVFPKRLRRGSEDDRAHGADNGRKPPRARQRRDRVP